WVLIQNFRGADAISAIVLLWHGFYPAAASTNRERGSGVPSRSGEGRPGVRLSADALHGIVLHKSVLARIYRSISNEILVLLDDLLGGIFQAHGASEKCLVVVHVELLGNQADDFALRVELGLHRSSVAVLGVLDDEHHPERHDRGAGVDEQLVRVVDR